MPSTRPLAALALLAVVPLSSTLVAGGGGGGGTIRPPSAGGLSAAPRVLVPGAPAIQTESGTRPLTRSELGGLTARPAPVAGDACDVDFDDDTALSYLHDGAVTTFVWSPHWNQACDLDYVRVRPTDWDHFHLGYSDPDVTTCQNPDNEYGTPFFEWSRGAQECEPIDPFTEPRSYVMPHWRNLHLQAELVDAATGDQRPFALERIRILNGPAKVCYRLPAEDLTWESSGPSTSGGPGASYCWNNLSPGLWDLSAYAHGVLDVTITGASSTQDWGMDDLRLTR